MATTFTIENQLNIGNLRGVIFKGVCTLSTAETWTASKLGLTRIEGVYCVGADGTNHNTFIWNGAAAATTGTALCFKGTAASSGTVRGIAVGF